MSETVIYDVVGGVATLTMNRPDAMNSLTVEMKVELREAVLRAGADAGVRAVVLTGAGRGFCAGQDLREHAEGLAAGRGLDTVTEHYNPLVTAITQLDKPVIAAVNGVAAGAGASLAFACDLRIASENARFVMSFAQVGLAPDSGASWTLPRLVGRGRAAELLLLAQPVDAARALEIGLVNSVVPADRLAEEVGALAGRMAAGPTLAYARIKRALDHAAGSDLADALAFEAKVQGELGATADHRAATTAFVRKERPVFEGR